MGVVNPDKSANGIITIDLAESLDDRREALRVRLGEPYRTILGHLRHEVGHYYQKVLIADDALRTRCRELFGDERESYSEALTRHYRLGAPADWNTSFISEYATMHPWEDFAETFAHYLHITGTLQTIAMDAKVQVDFNPAVVMRYRLVGFENRAIADKQFRDNTVDAGEIGAGHSVTALYEVKLYPEAYGDIATVFMRWQDPETRQVVELAKDFSTGELAYQFESANPYFQRAVVVAEYAEILKKSYWAEESSLAHVYHEAVRVNELLPWDENIAEFMELIRRASQLTD